GSMATTSSVKPTSTAATQLGLSCLFFMSCPSRLDRVCRSNMEVESRRPGITFHSPRSKYTGADEPVRLCRCGVPTPRLDTVRYIRHSPYSGYCQLWEATGRS